MRTNRKKRKPVYHQSINAIPEDLLLTRILILIDHCEYQYAEDILRQWLEGKTNKAQLVENATALRVDFQQGNSRAEARLALQTVIASVGRKSEVGTILTSALGELEDLDGDSDMPDDRELLFRDRNGDTDEDESDEDEDEYEDDEDD